MQGVADRQTRAHPATVLCTERNVDKKEGHLAHAEGHVTEVVQDDVGHADGQQESCRGTSTVSVPPPSAQ